jgi:hypothetical protein
MGPGKHKVPRLVLGRFAPATFARDDNLLSVSASC